MRISSTGQKWLKLVHLLAVAAWLGGALALLSLNVYRSDALARAWLPGVDLASSRVDLWVVVWMGAVGCMVTGLLFSLLTGWGFKRGWILLKYALTLTCVLIGTFALGPWETRLCELSLQYGSAAFDLPEYAATLAKHFWGGLFQIFALAFMGWLSVFKPHKKALPAAGR